MRPLTTFCVCFCACARARVCACACVCVCVWVFRWGLLCGGPSWSWPWDLEDSQGCTPLHIAAAQSPPVCKALLQMLDAQLPPPQLLAARKAWRESHGQLLLSPQQVFYNTSTMDSASGRWWWSPDSPSSPTAEEQPTDKQPREQRNSFSLTGFSTNNSAADSPVKPAAALAAADPAQLAAAGCAVASGAMSAGASSKDDTAGGDRPGGSTGGSVCGVPALGARGDSNASALV